MKYCCIRHYCRRHFQLLTLFHHMHRNEEVLTKQLAYVVSCFPIASSLIIIIRLCVGLDSNLKTYFWVKKVIMEGTFDIDFCKYNYQINEPLMRIQHPKLASHDTGNRANTSDTRYINTKYKYTLPSET